MSLVICSLSEKMRGTEVHVKLKNIFYTLKLCHHNLHFHLFSKTKMHP